MKDFFGGGSDMLQTITGIAVAGRTWQFSALSYPLILFTHTVLNFQDFNMSQNCYKLLTDIVY